MATAQKRTDREKVIDDSFSKYALEVPAKPVDTYVTPPRPMDETSNARLLAAQLGAFAGVMERHREKRSQEERAKGKKLYTRYGWGKSWADFRAANPNIAVNSDMKIGYLNMRMADDAYTIRQAITNEFRQGKAKLTMPDGIEVNVKDSDDSTLLQTWLMNRQSEYMEQFMSGYDIVDPELYSTVFLPEMTEMRETLMGEYLTVRQAAWRDKTTVELGGITRNKLKEHIINSTFDPAAMDMEDESFLEGLATVFDMGKRMGLSGGDIRDTVIAQVLALADDENIEDGDRAIELLLKVPLGDGTVIGDDPSVVKKIYDAWDEARQDNYWRELRNRNRVEWEREEKIRGISADVVRIFEKLDLSPSERWDQTHALLEPLIAIDPGAYRTWLNIVDDMYNTRHPKEKRDKGEMFSAVAFWERYLTSGEPMTPRVVLDGVKAGLFDGDTAMGLMSRTVNPELTGYNLFNASSTMTYIKERIEPLLNFVFDDAFNDDAEYYLHAGIVPEILDLVTLEYQKDPARYMNNMTAYRMLLDDVIVANKDRWAERLASWGFLRHADVSPSDYKGQDKSVSETIEAQTERGRNTRIRAIEEHNKAVSQGDTRETDAESFIKRNGWTVERFESETGAKMLSRSVAAAPSEKTKSDKKWEVPEIVKAILPEGDWRVSSVFDDIRVDKRTGKTRNHNGVDIPMPEGTPLKLPDLPGVSWVDVKLTPTGGDAGVQMVLGGYVPKLGAITLTYNHLSKKTPGIPPRSKTQGAFPYKVGDIIALSGNTGNSTGPHLDLKVQINGGFYEPHMAMEYIKDPSKYHAETRKNKQKQKKKKK